MKAVFLLALTLISSSAFAAACRDGEIQYFPDPAHIGDDNAEIPVVCKNGTFFAPTAPTRESSCREGETVYWATGDGDSSAGSAYFVCHNGVFEQMYAQPVRGAAPARCHEGQTDVLYTGGGDTGEAYTREVYVCRNGSFVRTR